MNRPRVYRWLTVCCLVVGLGTASDRCIGGEPDSQASPAANQRQAHDPGPPPGSWPEDVDGQPPSEDDGGVVPASLNQDQPALFPRMDESPRTPLSPTAASVASRLAEAREAALGGRVFTPVGGVATDVVPGSDAEPRATTDAGSLLFKSPSALGTGVQQRTPIINEPRVRGSRVGQLAASGSYWVPARLDLDTAVSKLDSRLIEQVTVVKGPYSALYGPGIHFIDIELLKSPRYDTWQAHGATGLNYKTNGQQWYGRQDVWGGSQEWGFRAGYGHTTGDDYLNGWGQKVPSGYHSRDFNLALGFNPSSDEQVEFNLLRLDQTGVEFPGQVFDIDALVTDGFELEYTRRTKGMFDEVSMEAWYNRTRFRGNAQNPQKRQQFPYLDQIGYIGLTDVDSASTGFRVAGIWGDQENPQTIVGIDLRYLSQRLDERGWGAERGGLLFDGANSPIPTSQSTNPGLFLEEVLPIGERLRVKVGGRVDWFAATAFDSQDMPVGLNPPDLQAKLYEILGTREFEQFRMLWSLYATGQYELNSYWDLVGGVGHGQRPPSLTELYAAETFLLVLQNGMNAVTGDPQLNPERVTQLDLGLNCHYPRLRAGAHGFFALAQDYITFETLSVKEDTSGVLYENLKYVNTTLATFIGTEAYAEYDWSDWLTPFASLQYVAGIDQTRNGNFATTLGKKNDPSRPIYGQARGTWAGPGGAATEPLPGISPLESRLGLRLHEPAERSRWGVEFSARVVDAQEMVAVSLAERPTAGFTVFDIRASWAPRPWLRLLAGVENVADLNYYEHLDFRSATTAAYKPGRNFYFGGQVIY